MLLLRSIAIDVGAVGVVAVPVLLIAQAIFRPARPLAKKLLTVAFSLCVIAIFSVTGLPTMAYHSPDISICLVPLTGFFGDPWQYIWNVILFLPIGFFAPLLWDCFRSLRNTALFGFCLSLFIELAQIFTFRVTDINDLCTNTLGAVVGFFLAKAVMRLGKRFFAPDDAPTPKPCAKARGIIEPALLIVLLFLLQYVFQPLISEPIWNLIL